MQEIQTSMREIQGKSKMRLGFNIVDYCSVSPIEWLQVIVRSLLGLSRQQIAWLYL